MVALSFRRDHDVHVYVCVAKMTSPKIIIQSIRAWLYSDPKWEKSSSRFDFERDFAYIDYLFNDLDGNYKLRERGTRVRVSSSSMFQFDT